MSFFFGEETRPLAGSLHRSRLVATDTGVVICNPFGIELLSCRRAVRHLAERLAAVGIPALRFDYDGTGESAGEETDPARLEAWLGSIQSAVDELVRVTGVTRVVLVGVRFGALLARLHAARAKVDGLVLVACPATGRAHLREQRTLESLRQGRNADDIRSTGEQLSGFFVPTEAIDALSAVDAETLPLAAPCDVLLATSDDPAAKEAKIRRGLSSASVTTSRTPGYADMMRDDPYKSVVPDALFGEIVDWIRTRSSPGTVAARAPVQATARIETGSIAIREEAVHFRGMFGVLSEPEAGSPPRRPAVLLLNIGANHRVGSGRLYVRLSRAFAEQGFVTLRFDRSGLGDSPARPGMDENYVYAPYGTEDVVAAMDFLARMRGRDRFVLGGVCSGAYFSYYAALADERVVSVLMMNLLTFWWTEGDSLEVRQRQTFKSTRFYAKAAFELETVRRLLRGEVNVVPVLGELAHRGLAAAAAVLRSALDRDPVLRSFRALDARKTDVYLLFSDKDAGVDLIEKHLGIGASRMKRRKHFSMRLISGADHTFLDPTAQERVKALLVQHLVKLFGAA
ncbi:MAG TPA: alpha/beta fold hydrolase [Polyangiaceae bacterium]|nr:alpha/beta fold hydrolase [Polyangiaceae bacterium]